jgi:hypothetical protein
MIIMLVSALVIAGKSAGKTVRVQALILEAVMPTILDAHFGMETLRQT